jgi:hypothetical protein
VSDHALLTDAQASAAFLRSATANSFKDHFVALGITNPNGGFHAAEELLDLGRNPFEESIEIENGVEFLDGLTQEEQGSNLFLLGAEDRFGHGLDSHDDLPISYSMR